MSGNQLVGISFFTGVGMFDLGFLAADYRIAAQIEYDPFCQKVLHARANLFNYPSIYGDVRDCGVGRKHQLPRADVYFGGFPCQPFSQVGKRQGKDDNRNMWGEFARLIEEGKPRAVVLENVPAILTAYRTKERYPTKQKYGLTQFRKGKSRKHPPYAAKVLYDLAQMGYVCSWGIISAADAGFPHQRDRWWCVGLLGDANGNGYHQPPTVQNTDINQAWYASACKCAGTAVSHETVTTSQAMVNTQSSRLQRGQDDSGNPATSGQAVRTQADPRSRRDRGRKRRIHESRLGGAAYGAADWMDRPTIPAVPGQTQTAQEAPRTRADKGQDWASRLKACGNGLIPQIAYALAVELRQILD